MLFSEREAIGFLREIIEGAIGLSTVSDAYPGFVLSDVNAFVFMRFFFGQTKSKADKFRCIINMLDVLENH